MNELSKKLNEILKHNLAKGYTGVSYAISVQGEMIAAGAVGTSGGQEKKPLTLEGTFNVASVSKVFCTLAVMKLVEMGQVELDTPVVEYLPKFTMPDPRYKNITLRHCLNHTSGLPGTQWKGFSVSETAGSDYYADVYDYFAHNYLKAEPGEYAVYCNDGFTLAELVVAEVSRSKFSDFCRQHIMQPLNMEHTRLSDQLDGNINVVREKNKPAELLLIQGAAGFTTTMPDLCKFGNMILNPEPYFSQESLDEMAKFQGKTFLDGDQRSLSFGLGWDNVNVQDPEYDLGEGTLLKGGNSFQFTTQFIVIPEYQAVLAISETHDCKIDVNETILRMFAFAMLERGVNIYKKQVVIPEEIKEKFSGLYFIPSGLLKVSMYGTICQINRVTTRGDSIGLHKNLKYDGNEWYNTEGNSFFFEEKNDRTYLLTRMKGRGMPQAQKAQGFAPFNQAWQERLGKKYVVIDTNPYDLIIRDIMTGFIMKDLPEHEGVLLASFSGNSDSGVYGVFEAPFLSKDDYTGVGFLNTPGNPSRDMITLNFKEEEGIEYCKTFSYLYRDCATLPVYKGEGFHQGKLNKVYKIDRELKTLPEIPNGRRLMVMKDDLTCIYDSLYKDEYKPVKEGYISFI